MDETVPPHVRTQARRWHARRGRGGEDIERDFARWLAADDLHRRAYDQIENVWGELGLIANTETGQTRKLAKAPFYMRRSTHVGCGTAALAAFACVLALGVAERTGTPALVSSAQAAIYRTGVGEIRSIGLAGGVRITLDTASIVTASEREPHRLELVRGRARFAVSGPGEGLTILAAGHEIRASDATFDVSVREGHARVASLQGDVRLGGAAIAGREVVELQGRADDHIFAREHVTVLRAGETRWVEGMLGFDGEPLADAIAMVNRYNRTRIEIGDLDPAAFKVTGAFAANRPRAFAEAIAATFGLDLEETATDVVVLRAKRR